MSSALAQGMASLKTSRLSLAIQRHDLLMHLRIVNSIEQELVLNNRNLWFGNEVNRCTQAFAALNASDKATNNAERIFNELEPYCENCRSLLQSV